MHRRVHGKDRAKQHKSGQHRPDCVRSRDHQCGQCTRRDGQRTDPEQGATCRPCPQTRGRSLHRTVEYDPEGHEAAGQEERLLGAAILRQRDGQPDRQGDDEPDVARTEQEQAR